MTESQSSSLSSMNELNLAMPEMPALLTRMSRPPPPLAGRGHQFLHAPTLGDVGGQAKAGCSLGGELGGGLLCALTTALGKHDFGALLGQPLRNAVADAHATPGDDRDLPLQAQARHLYLVR